MCEVMCREEEDKDQESIQSSTTPDPRNHMGKRQNTRKHHTQESQDVSSFPAGDHKAARNGQDSIIKTKEYTYPIYIKLACMIRMIKRYC